MIQKSRVVVFDLDDTLYKEQDYLQSAYCEIAALAETHYGAPKDIGDQMLCWWQKGDNVFQRLIETCELKLSVADLLTTYRSHVPSIRLDERIRTLLDHLHQHSILGIITDGRNLTQRHKVEALGLTGYMDEQNILISEETGYEKPSVEPFLQFMERYPSRTYYYIGDNPTKDFEAPNQLGWTTICLLDDGRNIHRQNFGLSPQLLPQYKVSQLSEIENIII